MKKLLSVLMATLLLIMLCSCTTNTNEKAESTNTESDQTKADEVLTFGVPFAFDDLEIVLSDDIQWEKIDNQFSENNGADVIKIPVTIKNNKDETHGLNMFYYTFYGPDGNKLDSVATYFNDDHFSAGNMRSGATQNTYFHILYKGDGDYYVEFAAFFGKAIEVKLPIIK